MTHVLGVCVHAQIPRSYLVQQVYVCDRVLDIAREVLDLSPTRGASEVVVHPANEDLFGS